ncbi:MAG: hypothetical protein KJ732_04880 [Candidatus Margulisbacteria bacterium]|nr:hypothetical protein [Candidatus Margulisiibacteriota bacterium]
MPALIVTNSRQMASRPARFAGKLFSTRPFHWLRKRELQRITPQLADGRKLYVDSEKLEYAHVSLYGQTLEWTAILAAQLGALKIERIIISDKRDAAAVAEFINSAGKSLSAAGTGGIEIVDLATEAGRRSFITSPLTAIDDIRVTFNNLRKAERAEVFMTFPSDEKVAFMANSNIYQREDLVELLNTAEKRQVIDKVLARLGKIDSSGFEDIRLLHELLKDEGLGYDAAKLESIEEVKAGYYARNKEYNLREAAAEADRQNENLDPEDFRGTGGTPFHQAGR